MPKAARCRSSAAWKDICACAAPRSSSATSATQHNATDADGWFPTGDLARIDAAGNLIITGRAKDLIKSGGEWINPAEIEAVVSTLPEVSLAAVIGRPHLKWGERPVLLVQTRDSATISDEALLAPLRGKVAPWWIPDEIIRVPRMHLSPTGKIDKVRLRMEYGGGELM